MSGLPPVTDTLVRFAGETDLPAISAAAREQAKRHMLDTFGVALAATRERAAVIAREHGRSTGTTTASVWGTREPASLASAAFINGVTAHALDYDDWDAYVHAGHPSSMITSAALTAGESNRACGRDLLTAYAVAIEVITKIAANAPNLHDRGFHSTPVWGTLGAAIAAARVLRLDSKSMKAALGIAASGCGGIQRQQGSMVKPFHAGNAARIGLEAALLAQKGFTADSAIIEAPRGFCDTFFGQGNCKYEKMVEDLGRPWFLESPGLGLKLHPCSAPQFVAADAALFIRREHEIAMGDVAAVEVRIPPKRYERHFHSEVRTGLRGKFAVNYVVALCLLDGKLEIATFTDSKATQPRVQEALGKVHVIVDESIPEPGAYCPVTVRLNDGRSFEHTASIPRGHPENPMTPEEVLEKFRNNARPTLGAERCEMVIGKLEQLETVGDVRELGEIMIPPAANLDIAGPLR